MNVAAYIAQFLVSKNVSNVFGYQGGAVAKLLNEIVATGCINFVQNYQEQASAMAADGYSRVSENIGIALATSGPGATNLLPGIISAQRDAVPTLFITGQDYLANVTADNGARQNGFQDLGIVEIVKPLINHASLVRDPGRIRYELESAWHHAKVGRGAALLDVPIDVQFAEIDPLMLERFDGTTACACGEGRISSLMDLPGGAGRAVPGVGGAADGMDVEQLGHTRLIGFGARYEPLLAALNDVLAPDGILCGDPGWCGNWLRQCFDATTGHSLLVPDEFGCSGFALAGAIGAKFAAPSRQVLAFMDDAGLRASLQELMLLEVRDLAIKCVVFNLGEGGRMVDETGRCDELPERGDAARKGACFDMKRLAHAYNLGYCAIDDPADLARIGPLVTASGPCLIDVRISEFGWSRD